MLTGRNALQNINLTLQQLRQQIDESDTQIQQVSDSLLGLRQQQAKKYQDLARIRLDHIISSETVDGLKAAERRVMELLQLREDELSRLSADLERLGNEQLQMEQQRELQADKVAAAARALDERETLIQQQLHQDQAYRAQLERFEAADRIASHAEEKMRDAQENREQKGRSYEEDPLFSYLWSRSYGTRDYAAGPLIRFLDKWVAGLCNYPAARPNYARLLEIPLRLQEHATRQRTLAHQELQALQGLEEGAAERDGIPGLRHAHTQAQRRLDEVDEEIQHLEERHLALAQQKAGYSSGDDARFRQAVDTLAESLQREDVDTLYRYARLTVTAEDDLLISELPVIDQKREQLQQTLLDHKRKHDKYLSRLAGLEQVRRDFKRERFDDIQSGFGNGSTVNMILNQFMQGLVDSADLWNTIRREQQYGRRSPGIPAGRRRVGSSTGTWRFPFPGGGDTGRGRSRGSGSSWSGGGFRTGGGF